MKDPRDILVAGIGFCLGMVFCYFITTREPAQSATAAINVLQTPPALPRWTTPVPVTNVAQLKEIKHRWMNQSASNSFPPGVPAGWPEEATLKKYGQPLIDSYKFGGQPLIDFRYKLSE